MREGRRTIRASRDGALHDVVVAWWLEETRWRVTVVLPAADDPAEVGAEADDAFEALCRVRDELEPLGWRLGVAGAQPEVWPSGMARDQGGGLRAYRMTAESAGDLVDTFAAVDPATVVTVAEQQAVVDGLVPAVGLATPRGGDDSRDVPAFPRRADAALGWYARSRSGMEGCLSEVCRGGVG